MENSNSLFTFSSIIMHSIVRSSFCIVENCETRKSGCGNHSTTAITEIVHQDYKLHHHNDSSDSIKYIHNILCAYENETHPAQPLSRKSYRDTTNIEKVLF